MEVTMSQIDDIANDPLLDLFDAVQQEQEVKKQVITELNDKKLEIEVHRTEQQYKKMKDALELKADLSDINIELNNQELVEHLVKVNTQYLNTVKTKAMAFLTDSFAGVVPYMPNNLILVGARTGRGKSTTCANLTYRALMQGKKVLNISNEEKAIDVYNRVTSLIDDEAYIDHANFSQEKIKHLNDRIRQLSQRLLVVDDDYVGKTGGASILEVLQGYITKAVETKTYDIILIDYYQKINISSENSALSQYEVQAKFADWIGDILKHPDCPAIVVMAQLKPDDKDGKPIEDRMEGRKLITKPATCILEAAPDYNRRCTRFIVHKTRWSENNGAEIDVGYVRGKYVKYDKEFQQYVEKVKLEQANRKMMALVKPRNDANGD